MKPIAYWISLCTVEMRHLRPMARFVRSTELWKKMTPAQKNKVREHAATLPTWFPRNTERRFIGHKRYMKKLLRVRMAKTLRDETSESAKKKAVLVALKQLDANQIEEMLMAARKMKRLARQTERGELPVAGHLAWAHRRARELRAAQPGLTQPKALTLAMREYSALPEQRKTAVRAAKAESTTKASALPKYIQRAAGTLPVDHSGPTLVQQVREKMDMAVQRDVAAQRAQAAAAATRLEKVRGRRTTKQTSAVAAAVEEAATTTKPSAKRGNRAAKANTRKQGAKNIAAAKGEAPPADDIDLAVVKRIAASLDGHAASRQLNKSK